MTLGLGTRGQALYNVVVPSVPSEYCVVVVLFLLVVAVAECSGTIVARDWGLVRGDSSGVIPDVGNCLAR